MIHVTLAPLFANPDTYTRQRHETLGDGHIDWSKTLGDRHICTSRITIGKSSSSK